MPLSRLLRLLGLAPAASLLAVSAPDSPPAPAARPNILFVAVDDLNAYVSFLRDEPDNFLRKVYPDDALRAAVTRRLTPNLDRLAGQSLIFSRAYCPSPLCGPSRTALLTGVPPHISGYYQHRTLFRAQEALRDVATLPEYLKAGGYVSVGFGKVFHGPVQRRNPDGTMADWPDIERSWTQFLQRQIGPRGPGGKVTRSPYSPGSGAMAAWDSGNLKTDADTGGGRKPDMDELFSFGTIDLPAEQTFDYENAAFAAELLMKRRGTLADRSGQPVEINLPEDRPFFLACGLYAPHLPWVVPPEFFERVPLEEMAIDDALVRWVEEDIRDLPPQALAEFIQQDWDKIKALGEQRDGPGGVKAAWRAALQAYLASIAYADHCLRPLVDAIEQHPARDHTIVVLWSDHGWNVGDKRRFRKHALWEGANHSVLLVRDPRLPASTRGAVCPVGVSLQDLYPTLVARAGLPRPEHVYGHDLTPLLESPEGAWDRPVLITYNPHNHAVRTATWSYLRYRDGGQELYDLARDPFEYHNLADDPMHADRLKEMDALLNRLLAETPADQR
ncbi:MAG TPA: sulfatase [Opitutaceae bacterium]